MAATDVTQGGVGQPATRAASVTPSDSEDLGFISRALYVGGAGDVEAIMLNGETVVFSAVPAGTVLPIRVSRVKDANTTATLILNLG